MMKVAMFLSAVLAICLLGFSPAVAGVQTSKNDPDLEQQVKALLAGSFITLACQVPVMQPQVATLSRNWQPSEAELIKQFFGSRENVTDTKEIVSPLWGKGKRFWISATQKSEVFAGTSTTDAAGKQGTKETEVVLMSLDIYLHGFVYINNAPHPPAISVEKIEKPGQPLQFNRKRTYSDQEGQKIAEQLVAQYVAPLKVPAGFQSNVQMAVQDYGKQLYQYRIRPEFITNYAVYDKSSQTGRKEIGRQPVSVPVYDAYVNLMLDGDKQLAGIEYFWDDSLKAEGQVQESISLGDAVTKGREFLFEYFKSEPPLITVNSITFGYVQDDKGSSKLMPAWLFDAWYMRALSTMEEYQTAPEYYGHNSVKIPLTYGVNALTGKAFIL
jgi:hypothetical protein